jgi:ABC-type multidrug transport system fused ATPase/permease subunit
MGFVMDGLAAEGYDREYSDAQLLRRIARYFAPFVPMMLVVAVAIFLVASLDALLPLLIATGIDRVGDAPPDELWQRTWWLLVAIGVAGTSSWGLNFLRQWLTARAVGNVVLKLRVDAFDAVMARDMSFYDEYSTGRIVSRVTADTQDFSNVVTLTLNLISQVLQVVIIAGILFWIDWRLATIALTITPFIVAAALAFRRIARRTTQQARRVLADVNANVQESITGIGVAKAFGQEQAVYDVFSGVNAQSYRLNLRQGLTFSAIFPILGTIAGIGTALVVYFGGTSVVAGGVTAGQWFLFVEAIAFFWFPLTSIASFWSQFQLGLSASERVFALVDAEPRVTQSAPSHRHGCAARSASRASTSATTRSSRSWPASTSTSVPARPWRSWGTRAPASRASANWSRASTSSRAVASRSTVSTCGRSTWRPTGASSASSSRRPSCSPARCATTSATPGPTRATTRCGPPRRASALATGSTRSRTTSTRWSARAAAACRWASAS